MVSRRSNAVRTVSPKDARLAEIDSEVERLCALIAGKHVAREADEAKHVGVAREADEAKHVGLMNFSLQERLKAELQALSHKAETLREERFDIELNGLPIPKSATVKSSPEDWEITKNLGPMPEYPLGARTAGRQNDIEDAHGRWMRWHEQERYHAMHQLGIHPEMKPNMRMLAGLAGAVLGSQHWLAKRCEEAEARIAVLESQPRSLAYRGVYREGEAYREGDTVTYRGNLYHCDTNTTDKPDGHQRCWTLAVRRGRDGKDATR
jgi:hypothetical protein